MHQPFAISLEVGSSAANHTGTWRTERPVYVSGLSPCNNACPAHEPVQRWLYLAEDGGYEKAWRELVRTNPFPAVMGRVCYHPCETACNRAQLDEGVGINSVERFLGDEALRNGWLLPAPAAATGRRVLVIGSGPCGLSAAYQLRLLGHEVEVYEAAEQAGGMMRHGIPTFRLPRDVLDIELARVTELGITVHTGRRVDDIPAAMAAGAFDAVLLATGAPLSHRAYVPAGQSAKLIDALSLLGDVAAGERPRLGSRVIVYGGGNTAMDAARTARRLGADDALVVYRRTRAQMPADAVEVDEAVAEGVHMHWLSTIAAVDGSTVRVERMRLDDDGKPLPTGEFDDLDGDTVVLALGQDVDTSVLASMPGVTVDDGIVDIDQDFMTGSPGIFAAGDLATRQRSVAVAVGQGARAARGIHYWLVGQAEPVHDLADHRQPVEFGRLNTWYFTDAPHAVRPRLDAGRRTADFSEVVGGLDADTALYEARRCLSCGNCFGCDNCYGVCPDNAVHKVDGVYVIDYDFCKGCGMCVAECPSGAIVMEPEPT